MTQYPGNYKYDDNFNEVYDLMEPFHATQIDFKENPNILGVKCVNNLFKNPSCFLKKKLLKK